MKKTSPIVVLLVAAIALFAAERSTARSDLTDLLVEAENIEEKVVESLIEGEKFPPLCCNKCGPCDRRPPWSARCVCLDITFFGCRPGCPKCVRVLPEFRPARYRCEGMRFDDCHRKCPIQPTLQAIVN